MIVEMKRRFSLDLVLQGVARRNLSDRIYLAVAAGEGRGTTLQRRRREVLKLCRLLGLGLLIVHPTNGAAKGATARVEARLDPGPYRPRQNARKRGRLLREFAHRVGDPNTGGSSGRGLVTAYRQDALRCAALLAREGPLKLALIRETSGVARAGRILQRDVYGWFERPARGLYALSPNGRAALETYAEAVAALEPDRLAP